MKYILFFCCNVLFIFSFFPQLQGNSNLVNKLFVNYENEVILDKKFNNSNYELVLSESQTIPFSAECNCFVVTPLVEGTLSIQVTKKGTSKGSIEMEAISYPIPEVRILGSPVQNTMTIDNLISIEQLDIHDSFGLFDFEIISFKMLSVLSSTGVSLLQSDSSVLTDEMKSQLQKVQKGSRIEFTNITLKRSDGELFVLQNFEITVI